MRELDERFRRAQQIATRIRNEAKTATRSWALIEAFNGFDEDQRFKLREGIGNAGLSRVTDTILKALARDTLSALFRVTDAPGPKGDTETFCTLVRILASAGIRDEVDRAARSDCPEFLHDTNARRAREAADELLRRVGPTWAQPPQDPTLHNLRERLKSVRDSLLSHALDYSQVTQSTFGETRRLLKEVNELQVCASNAFSCSTESLQSRWDTALKEAHRFWDKVESGLNNI